MSHSPRRRRTLLLASLLLVSSLVAGCTTADHPAEEEAPQALLYDDQSVSKRNLTADMRGLSVLFRVHENVTLNLTWTKRTTEGNGGEASDRCGSVAITRYAAGGGIVGEPLMKDGMAWGESSGRVFTIGLGGERETIEHPAARESMLMPLDWKYTREESFAAGEYLRISLYMDDPTDDLVSASVGVEAPHPVLELVEERPTSFRCSASLDRFEGEIISGGGVSSATVVRDAAYHETTENATTATFLVLIDPRFKGTCTTSISLNGQRIAETGPEENLCYLEAQGPNGSVEFQIDQLMGVGPVYLALLWDTDEP